MLRAAKLNDEKMTWFDDTDVLHRCNAQLVELEEMFEADSDARELYLHLAKDRLIREGADEVKHRKLFALRRVLMKIFNDWWENGAVTTTIEAAVFEKLWNVIFDDIKPKGFVTTAMDESIAASKARKLLTYESTKGGRGLEPDRAWGFDDSRRMNMIFREPGPADVIFAGRKYLAGTAVDPVNRKSSQKLLTYESKKGGPRSRGAGPCVGDEDGVAFRVFEKPSNVTFDDIKPKGFVTTAMDESIAASKARKLLTYESTKGGRGLEPDRAWVTKTGHAVVCGEGKRSTWVEDHSLADQARHKAKKGSKDCADWELYATVSLPSAACLTVEVLKLTMPRAFEGFLQLTHWLRRVIAWTVSVANITFTS
ncbi:hypothetical protein HDU86_006707 [Geranomyces michiganensis]|nr:hypothetical protein HDU86_006707 [Geranomyces michiganensis]